VEATSAYEEYTEGPSIWQTAMSATDINQPTLARQPKRADARRNYEKLVAAAREAFTEKDRSASLEDIARRAGVGIGTLYRHFPTRTDLIEAVYVEEVEALCRSADDLRDGPPWDALVGWLHRFIGYVATKHALAEELFAVADRDSEIFKTCRVAFYGAGEPLLRRAQEAGDVRPDVSIDDVVKMVGGIAKIQGADPATVERILSVALDGLRYSAD
jgi:AcrR family transcriptional regulator